ncbi:MAG: aldo/keto reductase, partial [Clostridia bacterium]|nr:aldo/keto reductase [Clostridia bacterium]
IRTSGIFLKETSVTEERLAKIRALNDLARERGESLAQMALSWLLQKKAVTSVLIGASKPEQIKENLKCVHAAPFTEEELKRIDTIAL